MRPILITCGDPNGIGPEIIVKTLSRSEYSNVAILGDPGHFEAVLDELGIKLPIEVVKQTKILTENALKIIPIDFKKPRVAGYFEPEHAAGVIESLETAISMCLNKTASGLVTAPINKAVLKEGSDYPFPGHTELLAARSNVENPVMMLVAPELRTVPVTIHEALSDVPKLLTPYLVKTTVRVTDVALRKQFDIPNPRLVAAGVNPHAGEMGKIGTEEQDWLNQTILELEEEGINISGPYPADTLFHAERRATYDVAICMYHDQALIPVKTLGFDTGINVTLGIPFIRTSPDHGTAFDIAGKGIANETSFKAALDLAVQLANSHD